MTNSDDYFNNVQAINPGKRRMSRLENNRILKSIAQKKHGYELNWTEGKASFMKSYQTKTYPRWFAKKGTDVRIQVSIRLIPGRTSKEAPIAGLQGIEVYYRFLKIIAIIEKEPQNKDLPENERTEHEEFSTGKNITEASDWMGSYLSNSSTARLYYQLLEAIGFDKIKRILDRTVKIKKQKGE